MLRSILVGIVLGVMLIVGFVVYTFYGLIWNWRELKNLPHEAWDAAQDWFESVKDVGR